jgi:hypothetical protein
MNQVESFFFGLATKVLDQTDIKVPLPLSEVKCSKLDDFSMIHKLVRKYQ